MTQRLFKMHIADEMNFLIKELEWGNSRRTIQIEADDITDDMVAQIQYAMTEDKKGERGAPKLQTQETYKDILYNDLVPKKEEERASN